MKKLRRLAGGNTYTIIYLKMQLLSVKKRGIILFESIEDNLANELALELDEAPEDVQMTLMFLEKHRLIEQLSADEYLLPEAAESVGTESASAERMRKLRDRKNANPKTLPSQCDTPVTASDGEVTTEKEKDIKLELYPPNPQKGETTVGDQQGNSKSAAEAFEHFWNAYPKQKARSAAEKEWYKLAPSPKLLEQILFAIDKQKQSNQWRKDNGQFIPEPARWLKDQRWNDQLENPVQREASYDLSEIESIIFADIRRP